VFLLLLFLVEDSTVSDFGELRKLLVRTHFRALVESTHTHRFTHFKLQMIKEFVPSYFPLLHFLLETLIYLFTSYFFTALILMP